MRVFDLIRRPQTRDFRGRFARKEAVLTEGETVYEGRSNRLDLRLTYSERRLLDRIRLFTFQTYTDIICQALQEFAASHGIPTDHLGPPVKDARSAPPQAGLLLDGRDDLQR